MIGCDIEPEELSRLNYFNGFGTILIALTSGLVYLRGEF